MEPAACNPATITSDQGSRINDLLKDLLIQSGADFALVVRTEGALIAKAETVITDEIENVGMLAALIYGAAQNIGGLLSSVVSFVHQHSDQKDLLILRISEQSGLIIGFNQVLGLGEVLYKGRRAAAVLAELLLGSV
jgi:predicted regulator of Ras-like GTPase activity (Roadblock/LC7/MglB family)